MPIYEYKCADCGAQLEKMQKVSDAPLTVCENCGGKLEKQWSLSGFQFKGEGWYVTDYAGKKTEKGGSGGSKSDKTDKSEKSSAAESTASADAASKPKSDTSGAPAKKDHGSKKD